MEPRNQQYTLTELMICAASHLLEDGKTAVIGTGAPLAAAMLAQLTHAPNLILLFEAGAMAPVLQKLPISVAGAYTQTQALMHGSMLDIMEAAQRGMIDYAFLSGAQIDAYGNLNSTMIGDQYPKPTVRLPGSGGANDFASLCWKTVVMIAHDRRKFVPRVDFITSPGYLDGPGARESAGLPSGTGPWKVISTLGVMGFHPRTKLMQVERLHPGVTAEEIRANTGFELTVPVHAETTAEPTGDELRILREHVDPEGRILGKTMKAPAETRTGRPS